MSEPAPEFVYVRVWDQSALALMDWLLTTDEGSLPYAHPAQKQAPRDLPTALEWSRAGQSASADDRRAMSVLPISCPHLSMAL